MNVVERNGSYEICTKSGWVGIFFHVLSFQISEGKTKTRIDYQAKLNPFAKMCALVFGSALFCFLVLEVVIQEHNEFLYVLARLLAVPFVFSPFALTFWLVKRQAAKEGIWFLKDLLTK
jgi:amino acid permease